MLKVLIADKNIEDARKISNELGDIFSVYKCSIELVSSWQEVETTLKNCSFEIAILDYYLEKTGGINILEIIKNEYPSLIIVIMTTKGSKSIAIDVAKHGADGYVSKNYGFDGIGYAIQNIINEKIITTKYSNYKGDHNGKSNDKKKRVGNNISNATRNIEKINNKLKRIIEIGKILSEKRALDDLLDTILNETAIILDADRTSLFLYDESSDELWSKIAEKSLNEIRFSINKGIAGYVARTRQLLNISDVYKCEMFNPEFDVKTGFYTKNMLCAPLESNKGNLIGVIQVLNKKKDSFIRDDEEILRTFASLVAVLIENARLSERNLKREKNAAIGEMARTIVHDLKNPMTTIRGYAQLMSMKAPDLIKPANIIMTEIDRLSNMAYDLLAFSNEREDLLEFERINCQDFFSEIFAFLKRDFKSKSIEINCSIKFSGEVEICPDKIRRAIFNVAGNALDAMENGGKFDIDIFESSDNKNVILYLSDTGCGIPLNIKENVFEPFVSSGKKRGTGLGLAITRKIINAHNGSISVDSEEGKGSIFKIALPIFQN